MRQLRNWIVAGGAGVLAVAVIVVAVVDWTGVGDAGLDLNGWIALSLGVVVTLALGIGLMALVFISNRRGYDEPPRDVDNHC
jgi:hypothetical protein